MIYKDYYKILDLKTSRVNIEELKIAYRAAAKKYHPDVNIGDTLAEERIKDINEAYRILSTPASKRKYDRIWNSRNNVKEYKTIKGKSIFNMFLGDLPEEDKLKKDKVYPIKGENVETEIRVSISDAYFGADKKLALKTVDGKMKTFSIKIPEGIKNGEKIRLIGQGKEGKNDGKNGDLLIKIIIEDDKLFKLENDDLYTELLITPWEAALGTRVSIRSIEEEAKVYIPQGTQTGERLKIPNKGYKNESGERGDLIAEIKIVVPKNLTDEEIELYNKLKDVSKFNPRKF